MSEEWLPIPGYEGRYCVSNLGNVMSMNYLKTGLPGLLRTQGRGGYVKVSLTRDAKQVSVHTLVLLAFVGPRPRDHVINHIDGDKANNALSNLEYCTQSENVQHAFRTGLRAVGEKHPRAKLTSEQVIRIRARLATGECRREIAAAFGVSRSTIGGIARGDCWVYPEATRVIQ